MPSIKDIQQQESPQNKALERPVLIGALFVFIGAVLFSTKAIFVKLAYQYPVDSIGLLTLRMLFSLPVYIVIGWLSYQKKKDVGLTSNDWLSVITLGFAGYYLASLFDFWGLKYVSAGMERLILFAYPTLVLLFSAIVFKKKIHSYQIIAVCITYIGIGFAFVEKAFIAQEQQFLLGAGLVFMAAITFAVYIVGSGQLLPRLGTWLFTSLAMMAASFAVIMHNGIVNQWDIFNYHPHVYWYGVAMAIFATVLPSFLISEGIRQIGANNASIIGSIGPISTIILAYIFLGERLGYLQMVGTAIVIAGVLIITSRKKSPK